MVYRHEGVFKPWYPIFPLSWAFKECRSLTFPWSFGPLIQAYSESELFFVVQEAACMISRTVLPMSRTAVGFIDYMYIPACVYIYIYAYIYICTHSKHHIRKSFRKLLLSLSNRLLHFEIDAKIPHCRQRTVRELWPGLR